MRNGNYVVLLLYVDDILIAVISDLLVRQIARGIAKKLRISSEGPIENYLGIDIEIKVRESKVLLSMEKYVEKMLIRFKMKPRPSVNTPLPESFQNTILESPPADEVFLRDFEYKSKVGSLLYFMICMRPDIAFHVGLVARYSIKSTKAACAGVTQLLNQTY